MGTDANKIRLGVPAHLCPPIAPSYSDACREEITRAEWNAMGFKEEEWAGPIDPRSVLARWCNLSRHPDDEPHASVNMLTEVAIVWGGE